MSDIKASIQLIDQEIRAGNAVAAERLIFQIKSRSVPRDLRLKLATLSRRAGLLNHGLRFLSPVIHRNLSPTASELAEYSVLLLRSDVVGEAWEIMKRVEAAQAPEVLLYQAFYHFQQWQESEAIPLLEKYIRLPLTEYQLVVGKVNLAAALIGDQRYADAISLLDSLIVECKKSGAVRLLGNCFELRAQAHLKLSLFEESRGDINQAVQLLGLGKTADRVYASKWQAVLDAMETQTIAPLENFRSQALRNREWESVREADRFILKLQFDQSLFDRLLIGTPLLAYRNSLLREHSEQAPSSSFAIGRADAPILDLAQGTFGGVQVLKAGGQSHKLLSALMKDFYRPVRVGGLFSELFPGERFSIATSPDRVHQAIRRLRVQLSEAKIPLEVVAQHGDFSIAPQQEIAISIPYKRGEVSSVHLQVSALRQVLGGSNQFTAHEAREKLGLPRTTFQRLLNSALEQNQIIRIGSGSATKYTFPSASKAA